MITLKSTYDDLVSPSLSGNYEAFVLDGTEGAPLVKLNVEIWTPLLDSGSDFVRSYLYGEIQEALECRG